MDLDNQPTSVLAKLYRTLPYDVLTDLTDYLSLHSIFEQKKTDLTEIYLAQLSEIQSLRKDHHQLEESLNAAYVSDDLFQTQVAEMELENQKFKQQCAERDLELESLEQKLKELEFEMDRLDDERRRWDSIKQDIKNSLHMKLKEHHDLELYDNDHLRSLRKSLKILDNELKKEMNNGCYLELEVLNRSASLERLHESGESVGNESFKDISVNCKSFQLRPSLTPVKGRFSTKCSTPNNSKLMSFNYDESFDFNVAASPLRHSLANELDITGKQIRIKSFNEIGVQTDKKIVCFIESKQRGSEGIVKRSGKKTSFLDIVKRFFKVKRQRPSVSSEITVHNTCVVNTDHYVMECLESKISDKSKNIARAFKKLPQTVAEV